jgi:hypothetical protein
LNVPEVINKCWTLVWAYIGPLAPRLRINDTN